MRLLNQLAEITLTKDPITLRIQLGTGGRLDLELTKSEAVVLGVLLVDSVKEGVPLLLEAEGAD